MNDLKILIAFHCSSSTIGKTVNDILKVNVVDGWDVSLILVENGELKNYRDKFESISEPATINVEYLYYPESGKSKALNYAIQNFEDKDFILFTDDDITVNEDWVVKYIEAIRKHPKNTFFGGGMECEYEEEPSTDIKHLLPRSALGATDESFKFENRLFLGCNWGCLAKHIKSVGYFNENLGPGTPASGQETNMQRRLLKNGGFKRLVKNNYVYHFVPTEKCSWSFLIGRASKIMKEKKNRKKYLFRRVASELLVLKKNLNLSPKRISPLMYTLKYSYLRIKNVI